MSQKVANIFQRKVIEKVLFCSGEVLELEDDSHIYLFEEIYREAGIKSRLPVWKRGENYEVKRVKQYLVEHIKKNVKPFIKREFARSYDYTSTLFSLCDKNSKTIKLEDIDLKVLEQCKGGDND